MLGHGAAAGAMAGLACWRAIGGISDGLVVSAAGAGGSGGGDRDQAAPSLEECLLPAWGGPFGWMVVAEPVMAGELQGLADDEARRERLAAKLADRFPEQDVQARRHRDRHAELRQGRSTGMWRVHLLAGGTDPAAAARIAGLVCASADLQGLPYSLTPAGPAAGDFRALLDAAPAGGPAEPADDLADLYGEVEPRSPFHASTGLLAALARTPEREIPGLRLALRPDFDVTQEAAAAGPAGGGASIRLGQVLDRQRMAAGSLRVPLDSLNRHVFVCGATGGGKSQTVRGLLEAASRAGVPWLVVEPAKAEYRLMAARLAGRREVVRIRPGDLDAAAAGLNPLEPAADGPGGPVPAADPRRPGPGAVPGRVPVRRAVPAGASAALTRCYEEAGWDLVPGEPLTPGCRPPTRGWRTCSGRDEQVVEAIGLRAGDHRRRPRVRQGPDRVACGWAPPGGSSAAATRWTSAGCWPATWCWRSRTAATTGTRPS